MTLRHKSREFALQMLFQWDIARQNPARIEQHFWETARAAEPTRNFAHELFVGAVAQVDVADALISELSENWRLDRLAAIDKGILRLAIYEFRFGTAPPKVVIDEALELAKKFSSDEAPAFLNGILDAVLKKLSLN